MRPRLRRNLHQPIIGLSASGTHTLPALAKLVIAVRLAVPEKLILVSGPIIGEAEEEVKLMGVDGMAPDYDSAFIEMERLWAARTARQRQ